ncbi:hypothetical protein ACWCV9_18080 [Streptomyces sp. NPDC001606]
MPDRRDRPPDDFAEPRSDRFEDRGGNGVEASGQDRYADTGNEWADTGDEWAPGDATPGRRAARAARPEERLPGEPGARSAPGGAAPAPDEPPSRLPGAAGPGRDGLTGDDRGPAGSREDAWSGGEGLRPGTEELASGGEEGAMPEDGLGAPAAQPASGREARSSEAPDRDAWPGGGPAPAGTGAPLLPHEETERWEQRLRELAAGFVEQPGEAVAQADRALEDIAQQFGEAVSRRRRTLRMSWQDSENDTEQLRLALRDYRELAGRLLHL